MVQLKRHVSKGAAAASAAVSPPGRGSRWPVPPPPPSGCSPAAARDLHQCPASAQARGRRPGHLVPAAVQLRALGPAGRARLGNRNRHPARAPATQDHATLALKGGQVDAAGIQASNPVPAGGDRRHRQVPKRPRPGHHASAARQRQPGADHADPAALTGTADPSPPLRGGPPGHAAATSASSARARSRELADSLPRPLHELPRARCAPIKQSSPARGLIGHRVLLVERPRAEVGHLRILRLSGRQRPNHSYSAI